MQSIESKALEEKGSTRQEPEILKLRTKDKEFENELEVEAQLQLTKQHPLKSKKFHSRYGT